MIYCLAKYFINRIAVIFAKNSYARSMGIRVHEDNYLKALVASSIKLYMESYFDIVFCTLINMDALVESGSADDFLSFF